MANYRQLYTSFWQDAFILAMPYIERYFYIYLMTNSKTNLCGIYELPRTVAVLETGLPMTKVNELMDKFEKQYHRIVCSTITDEIVITNWMKHNDNPSPKFQSAVQTAFNSVKDRSLIRYVYGIEKKGYGMDTVSPVRATNPTPITTSVSSTEEPKDEEPKHQHGEYKNVMLTDNEYTKLKAEISDTDAYIEDLSAYIEGKGVSYKSHYAVIRKWKQKDVAEGKTRKGKPSVINGRPDAQIGWLDGYMKEIERTS